MSLPDMTIDALATLRPAPAKRAGATILIVDDDPVFRSLTRDALEDEGFEVVEAADGVEACRRCEALRPAMLVADVMMPNMDGYELCRELRRRDATQHLPILMATSLHDHQAITRAYEAGATDFIVKPMEWSVLNQRVRFMLRDAPVRARRHPQRRCGGGRARTGQPGRIAGGRRS